MGNIVNKYILLIIVIISVVMYFVGYHMGRTSYHVYGEVVNINKEPPPKVIDYEAKYFAYNLINRYVSGFVRKKNYHNIKECYVMPSSDNGYTLIILYEGIKNELDRNVCEEIHDYIKCQIDCLETDYRRNDREGNDQGQTWK